jgi:hypothetical protein
VFQLRQRVKMGKTEMGLAFYGSSNYSVITKEYTRPGRSSRRSASPTRSSALG